LDCETEQLKEKVLHEYREADRLGFVLASRNLGVLAYEGKLVKKDFHEAYVHFDTAAGYGMPEAHLMLGQMHENGEGVPVTYRDAAYHYRLAALGGDIEALRRLCNFYLTGKGVSQDFDRAIFWLGLLMQKGGGPGALVAYGDALLRNGDYANSRKLFEQLLDNDGTWLPAGKTADSTRIVFFSKNGADWLKGAANERLSLIYERGWGVVRDPAKAQKYQEMALSLGNETAIYASALDLIRAGKKSEALPLIEKAAAKGLPQANYSLGDLYCRGDGVPKDEKKGLGLMRKAAKAGYVDAELGLAEATLQHLPGAPELEEAIRLAEAAEAQGHPKAKQVCEQLEALREKRPADSSSSPARPM
jgi:TPR repeat protein